ncbi:MAG: hypothetical protein IJ758_03200 [Clostridia bacterium]|nr:hypothetical protein [Clostridia bacterium]
MKELNKDKLKSVSGAGDWNPVGGDGKGYFLNTAAVDKLEEMGYTLEINNLYTPSTKMHKYGMGFAYDVTDANGNGIGDNLMQEIFGNPVAR